jgi:WS/DGAT/MGAT family acyltransferase
MRDRGTLEGAASGFRRKMREHDRIWLHDSPQNRMIINAFYVIERVDFDVVKRHWRERVIDESRPGEQFERFRLRVVADGGQRYWELDPEFRLERHVVHASCDSLESESELQEFIGRAATEPLPADRPLWQVQVVERFGDDSSVVLFRVHHCMGDGLGMLPVLLALLDEAPALPGASLRAAQQLVAKARPPAWRVAAASLALMPWVVVRRLLAPPDESAVHGVTLSGAKRVAWTRPFELDLFRRARTEYGVTINDVLMSTVGGAFRRLFELSDPDRGREITVSMPVSMRGAEERPRMENRFATVFLRIPLDPGDLAGRIAETKRRLDHLKRSAEPLAMYAAVKAALWALPSSLSRQLVSGLAGKCTCVVTNVPGPQADARMGGRKVRKMMFWVPQLGNIGIGISFFSMGRIVRVGVISDSAVLDEPGQLVEAIEEELGALAQRLGRGARSPHAEKLD